jgi:hypothetical protein
LLASKGYGSIYHAFVKFEKQKVESEGRVDEELLRVIQQRRIHPVQHLYEMWAFLEIYDTLVSQLGFRPPSNEYSPLERCRHRAGNLEIDNRRPFKLEFRLGDGAEGCLLTCAISYDMLRSHQKGGKYQPDVFLEFEGRSAVRHRFAIDAKYRNYRSEQLQQRYRKDLLDTGSNSVYEWDLLHTAKRKYLDDLDCQAAFIVHSDLETPDYWGGDDHVRPGTPDPLPRITEFPGHRYGSIGLVPERTTPLVTLLRCMLMYHMGIVDICWKCRRRVRREKNERRVGWHYLCDSCSLFWIETWCFGEVKHPLIMFGRQSFHETKPSDDWFSKCPKCGAGDLT